MITVPLKSIRNEILDTLKSERLSELPQYSQRYNNSLGPLVYAKNPPSWEDALASVYRIAKQAWGNDILV